MPNIGDAAQSNGDIMRRLRELEAMVRELTAGRRLENASVGKGGIRVREDGSIRSETFDGNLLLENPGTAGWALGADRLAIRGQFVGPFSFDAKTGDQTGFSVTTDFNRFARVTIPVPEWAEEAIILSGHVGQAQNGTGAASYLTIRGDINGDASAGVNIFADPTVYATGSITHAGLVQDPAGSITVETILNSTGTNWGSGPINYAASNAIVLFRRVS